MTSTLASDVLATASSDPPVTLSGLALARLLAGIQRRDQMAALSDLPPGDGLVRIPVKGAPIVIVRNAEHARHVLVQRQELYTKGIDYKVLAVLLGRGLLTNFDPVGWQRQRALVQPLFAKRHLGPMADQMVAAAEDWLEQLEPRAAAGATLDVNEAMMGLTLDVVGRALFGASLPQRDVDAVGESMTVVLRAAAANARVIAFYRALGRLPGVHFDDLLRLRRIHWRRAQHGIARIDEVVHGLIDQRLREGLGDDLLSLLLGARDADGGGEMDREQVRDEVTTFLAAGHETTANAMTWLWLLLSRHPDARHRLEAEVDEVLGDRRPTLADADRLPWTTACLNEAMRIFPPVPAISRVSMRRDELGGLRIPAGTVMVVLPYLIHRDPGLWPNPEGFDPERFMPGAGAGRPRQAFMPFGAGRRICVGSGFATIEGTLLAAMTARRYRLDLVPGTRIRREVAITMRPRDGMPMTLTRR